VRECRSQRDFILVERSLLKTAIGFSSWTSAQWLADHEEPTRQGSRHRQNAPYQRVRTKDGYLMVGAAGQSIWARCAAALGHPEWCGDPRFATNQERMQSRAALEAEMNAVLTTKTTEHWVEVIETPSDSTVAVGTARSGLRQAHDLFGRQLLDLCLVEAQLGKNRRAVLADEPRWPLNCRAGVRSKRAAGSGWRTRRMYGHACDSLLFPPHGVERRRQVPRRVTSGWR
jgi:hypothetical protein